MAPCQRRRVLPPTRIDLPDLEQADLGGAEPNLENLRRVRRGWKLQLSSLPERPHRSRSLLFPRRGSRGCHIDGTMDRRARRKADPSATSTLILSHRQRFALVVTSRIWPWLLPLPQVKKSFVTGPHFFIPLDCFFYSDHTTVTLPFRLQSRGNFRGHTKSLSKSARKQRGDTKLFLQSFWKRKKKPSLPIHLHCIRVAPRRLDQHENLPMAFKSVVDGFADWLEIDDRHPGFRVTYDQKKDSLPHTYGCILRIREVRDPTFLGYPCVSKRSTCKQGEVQSQL